MRFTYFFFLISLSVLLVLSNCRKENFLTDSGAKVEFSKDTVVFDTVFVTIGSTYQRFTINNPQNQSIILSNVRLANGTRSAFRINVDGLAGPSVNDIEIPAKDSVYVFVEVTVDPSNQNNPFVIEDDVVVTINGNEQQVHLVAWGQDAYFHFNENVCGQTWLSDKPHVLYGISAVGFPGVDSNCTLIINPGTQIYAHADAFLFVYKSSLFINGDVNNRVVFQGDRREASYNNVPGQWYGIRFLIPQTSEINYATIKNGIVGIQVDTASGSDFLEIKGTQSLNHTFASLFAQGAHIRAENSQFGKAGNNSVALRLGGDYFFNHCTIDNEWTESTRNSPALILNNYFESGGTTFVRQLNTSINNSIIYGSNDNEITLDTFPVANAASYLFNRCLYKTDQPTNSNFVGGFKNTNPLFKNSSSRKLQSNSPAIDAADSSPTLFLMEDILGEPRSNPADIGCFEFVP